MRNTAWTTESLIKAIADKGPRSDAAFKYIYSDSGWKEQVYGMVVKSGGSQEDAAEVFQETLIALNRNILKGMFDQKSSLRTYFISIAKRLWWRLAKRNAQPLPDGFIPNEENEPSGEDLVIAGERKALLEEVLSMLSERCQILISMSVSSYTMKEIAQAVGLSHDQAAKKETYRCRERLRKLLGNNPGLKNLLQ